MNGGRRSDGGRRGPFARLMEYRRRLRDWTAAHPRARYGLLVAFGALCWIAWALMASTPSTAPAGTEASAPAPAVTAAEVRRDAGERSRAMSRLLASKPLGDTPLSDVVEPGGRPVSTMLDTRERRLSDAIKTAAAAGDGETAGDLASKRADLDDAYGAWRAQVWADANARVRTEWNQTSRAMRPMTAWLGANITRNEYCTILPELVKGKASDGVDEAAYKDTTGRLLALQEAYSTCTYTLNEAQLRQLQKRAPQS